MQFGNKDVVNLWRQLQKLEWQTYLEQGAKGVFSFAGHPIAEKVKKIVKNHFIGKCLDIGCGCLPKPTYMVDGIEWYGIDPLEGDKKREFNFRKGLAEDLPFPAFEFDGVLFATSIDHVINPNLALAEAFRVLKQGGKVIVWYSRRGGVSYEKWKHRKKAQQYNKHHQWAFDDDTMSLMVQNAGFHIIGLTKLGSKNRVLIGVKT